MTRWLTFRYRCSILLCLWMLASSASTWGQALSWPTGVQLSMDILRPFQGKYNEQKGTQYELNAAVDCTRWILEGDWGWGNIDWRGYNSKTSTYSSYTNDGQYFRIGPNYNLLKDTPDKNMAFLGLRYAQSFFKDHLVSKVLYDSAGLIKDIAHPMTINSVQNNVTGRWLEAVAGVKVMIWKLLYIGGTIRYQFGLHFNGATSYIPYDVPGWGLNKGAASFRLNLYLSIRIPFARNTLPDSSQTE